MHIGELDAFHIRVPLRRPISHASHSRSENDTLLVRCRLSDGTIGWGEGLPRPYVTGETIESVWEQLQGTRLAHQLDPPLTSLEDVVEVLDGVELAEPPEGARDCFGNALFCALELAVLDATCRHFAVPLSEVTSVLPEAEPIRKKSAEVRYSGVITTLNPVKTMYRALSLRVYGFEQIKVKVGAKGVNDGAMLRRVRGIVGPAMDIRLDANEAWSAEDFEARLEPLVPCRISSVEQPLPHGELMALREIRRRVSTPIMLDESLCSYGDGVRAIQMGLCDYFNLRLSKCGGFIRTARLAGLAHQAGMGYQLGCQVGETAILSAAGRHFATSIGGIRWLEGSFDRYLLEENVTREDIGFRRRGVARALSGSGLGISVDQGLLERMTVARMSIPIRGK